MIIILIHSYDEGNEDELKRLLMNSTNINATDQNGNSLLIIAALTGNTISDKKQRIDAVKIRTAN